MRSLKIYVAAKFENFERVLAFQNKLVQAGHVLTCNWAQHACDHPGYFREKPLGVDREMIAAAELFGVRSCDVLCLFPHPAGASAYAEAVGALLLQKPVLAISDSGLLPSDRTFLHLPEVRWLRDEIKACTWLSEYAGL